jgi:hypothetical protein
MLTEIKKELPSGCCSITQQPEYPWGTRLNFTNDMVTQLGLDKIDVGTKVMITAEAVIVGKTVNEGSNETHRDISIQLTAVMVNPDRSDNDRVTKLYR